MKTKTVKRINLIVAAIIVALAMSLAMTIFLNDAQPKAQAADTVTLYKTEYKGDNGTTASHLQLMEIKEKYNWSDSNNIYQIYNGNDLYNFLTGNVADSKKMLGFLVRDVYLSYNADKDGYSRVNVNSSDAIFQSGRILDGNGYTINIYGGCGDASTNLTIKDNDRAQYGRQGDRYDDLDVWYEYTGFLVAQNYGTIKDCTINYTSPHHNINAVWGQTGKDVTGALGMDTNNKLLSHQEGMLCAGIIAGLNGYGGVIDNIKLNVNSAFTAVKKEGTKHGWYLENGCYAGSIAGRAEDNSVINKCWVDLAAGAGVFAGSQGQGGLSTDERTSFAVSGGLVGNLNAGTAKITYCALTGTGDVKAFGNRAPKAEYFKIYAGGVVGGCVKIGGHMSILDGYNSDEPQLKYGQIKGIMSSWTGSRFTNIDNTPRQTVGSLFGVVGTDDNILSVALLYNFEALKNQNVGKSEFCKEEYFKASDEKLVLDSAGKFKNWLEINPTTDGGVMTAEFDIENDNYDIRVQIIADGHDEFKESGEMDNYDMLNSKSRYKQYQMNNGEGGGFIWAAPFIDPNGEVSNHIDLTRDDPKFAEIYMISSKNCGKYNYQFGKMGIIKYEDSNGSGGNLVKDYHGSSSPLKLPNVYMTNYAAFETKVFENEELWYISRNNKEVKLAQTYMPGTYTMKLQTMVGSERLYAYYDENERILAWQPEQDYVFTILQGKLNFGNGTTPTDGWQKQVKFELTMESKDDFDTIEFMRNGAFPSEPVSSDEVKYERNNASAIFTVNAGTGKNGTSYTFYAYKYDTVSKENVVVAVSESRIVRIDKEAPEVSDIEYYMVEDGQEILLSDDDLEEIEKKWTKNIILAKFSVSENGKSGIASAASGTNIQDEILNNNGDRNVVVTIKDSKPMGLEYVDAKGNKTVVELQVNVDRVEGKLSFLNSSYKVDGRFNYSTKSVTIRYVAKFGLSGWRMYYSYQRDDQGNDIWEEGPELKSDSGAVRTFTIDWNMGNAVTGEKDLFKIKMVNEIGLYEDEVFPLTAEGERYPNDAIGEYIIWLRLANIYLDVNLDNIFTYKDGEPKSVKEILENGETSEYFDKQYDNSCEYKGQKFYADLSALSENDFYYNDKVGVLYTAAGMSRPPIKVGSIVPVEVEYTSTDVGATQVSFRVVLSGTAGFNYSVYFTDLSKIKFYEDVEVENGKYWESVEIDAEISKRSYEIQLKDQEAFNSGKIYYYGDEIPTQIIVYIDATGEYVPINIVTQASSTASASINGYEVEGSSAEGYENIEYTVIPTTITINKRPVSVDLVFDGGEVGNIPTGIKAGKFHTITGTYEDVNGEKQKVNVEYILDGSPIDTLATVGEYIINISLSDNNNYVINGQTSFRFSIAQGPLEITTGVIFKEYTESQQQFEYGVPNVSTDLYSADDIKVTYYKYLDGATYNAAEKKVVGKPSNDAMTEYPTEIGYYLVKVEYDTDDNPNFFRNSNYDDGYLIIQRAKTQVKAQDVSLEYYYTSEKHTFNLAATAAEVISSSGKQLWSSSTSADDGAVKVQYKNARGIYEDVAVNANEGGGWYSETGRYEYRVSYSGNDNYEASWLDVIMIINPAELTDITFDSVEVVYDGKNHLPKVEGLERYSGLKVTFQYKLNQISCDAADANTAIKQFSFVSVGEYTVSMSVSKEGYSTKDLQSKVKVKKAHMEGVSASALEVDYDGKRHDVTISGLDKDKNGNYTYKGEPVVVVGGEGDLYATNVYMQSGVPTNYSGTVKLTSSNYEDLTLNTYIKINQAAVTYQEVSKTLPSNVESGIDVRNYKGYFVDTEGKTVECSLQYRKYLKGDEANGEIVTPDENGVIADGKYTVWLVVPNDNYCINDRYWVVNIGEGSGNISVGVWVGIAVGAVVAVAAVVAVVVIVVKKKKRAGA